MNRLVAAPAPRSATAGVALLGARGGRLWTRDSRAEAKTQAGGQEQTQRHCKWPGVVISSRDYPSDPGERRGDLGTWPPRSPHTAIAPSLLSSPYQSHNRSFFIVFLKNIIL